MTTKKVTKQIVGIDIGKDSFYACYKIKYSNDSVSIKGTKSFNNDISGMQAFLLWCKRRDSSLEYRPIYIMEATGVYYENLTYFLYENNQKVSIQLAQKLAYFAKSNNLKTKTDKVDSKMIARFGVEKCSENLLLWTPPSKKFKVIRDLSREHGSLKKELTVAKSQLHAMKHAHEIYSTVIVMKKEMINFYEKQLKQVEKELKSQVKSDAILAAKIKNIEGVKGLGFITIIKVISEANGFLLFKNIRQLVSYSGLDIVSKESGNHQGKTRISKKGNARIRAALYMPAMTASRHNKTLKVFYEHINQGRTIKKQGLIAVMRKLLILIYTLWKKEEAYVENYKVC